MTMVGAFELVFDEDPVAGERVFTEDVGAIGADAHLYPFEFQFEADGLAEEGEVVFLGEPGVKSRASSVQAVRKGTGSRRSNCILVIGNPLKCPRLPTSYQLSPGCLCRLKSILSQNDYLSRSHCVLTIIWSLVLGLKGIDPKSTTRRKRFKRHSPQHVILRDNTRI